MAPRRTSNRLRTSPVSAATFFVKSIRVGFGRNFLISVARFSSCERVVNRDWRISCSCTGVYGAKWIVCTLDDGRKAFDDDEDVRVCVLAMPMSRRTAGTASVRVKIDVRDWAPGVMWSSSSRMRILKEATVRTGANCNSRANIPFRVQPVQKSLDCISTLEFSTTRRFPLGPVAEVFDHPFPQCINALERHAIDKNHFDVAVGDSGQFTNDGVDQSSLAGSWGP